MKKNYLLLLGICLSSHFVHAQTSFASLEEIWHYADQHSVQLQTATGDKLIAAYNVKQAYGAIIPTITANGGFTDNIKIQSTLIPATLFNPAAPPGTFTAVAFGTRFIYNGALAAQMDLLNTQDWFNIKAARLNNELATQHIAKTKSDLYTKLANAYYSYILLEEAEKLSQDNVKTTSIIYDLSNNKFKDGLISEVTVNTALINKQKAAKNLEVAIQNKLVQLNNLKLLLNIRDSIAITEKMAEKTQSTEAPVFAEDPNVGVAYTQLKLSENTWKSSKAAYAPTLSAFYQYSTQILGNNFLKFNNSNTTPQQYWGLRLSVPIFSGNTRHYQVQKNKTDLGNKQKLYDDARLQADINNENLLINYRSSLDAFMRAKKILTLYQRNDKHAAQQLDEGIISLDDRLKVFSDLITDQNEYLQNMSDYFIQDYNLQIRQKQF
ncbi:TolC family protein [Chitinophaga sp. 30R24]|uniref:TolC family protein n=1 Tax=Chitinophaga sp. 30R24 TaxID=3248838 RepID=UPI003B8FC609